MKLVIQKYDPILVIGGIILSSYSLFKGFVKWKPTTEKDESKIGLLPDVVMDIDEEEGDYESDEDEEEDEDAPFVPKKQTRWWHFFTKYFEKEKPPIDRTMLALHKSAMAFIRKIPSKDIPNGHIPTDDL